MKRRIVSILGVIALLSGLIVGALPAQAAPPGGYEPIDKGPQIRSMPATADMLVLPDEPMAVPRAMRAAAAAIGDQKYFLLLDDAQGKYFITMFTLRAQGDQAEIWVQNNLNWPAGDPRPAPVVTDEQLNYLLDQFQRVMLPKETEFFRAADFHDGSAALLPDMIGVPADYYADDAGRTIILVQNVRDYNYYDPTYPNYIAGFYSPSFEAYFDRNVITIDSYDWANRVGPDGSRPHLYDGTIAHEYQHLLHDDTDSDEETWVNEGCADFAEFLCGYGHPDSHVQQAIARPENSLVAWEDQGGIEVLSDYGHAYLWTLYLNDKFGSPLIQAVFNNPENGITGVNAALQAAGINKTFADLYADWAVALLIDSKTPGGGRYQFDSIDIALDLGTPDAPNEEAYATPGVGPWGTDYIWITGDPKELGKLQFNGVPVSMFPTGWSSDGNVLWGGAGDEIENWAIFTAPGGGTLTFDTKYDIEEWWDFGFVQVSTDGGHTWTSLANEFTTSDYDPNAYPTVKANVPGLTGVQADWTTMSFSLAPYAGQEVLIAFRYVTDWASNGNGVFTTSGWYIDNVKVDDTLISDGSSVEAFKDITEIVPIDNDFIVTFVGMKGKDQGTKYSVASLKLSSVTEEGLFELNKVLKDADSAVMLVTFAAPQGFNKYVDYSYSFGYTSNGPKK